MDDSDFPAGTYAYGRDVIDEEKLRCIAAMEMFGVRQFGA